MVSQPEGDGIAEESKITHNFLSISESLQLSQAVQISSDVELINQPFQTQYILLISKSLSLKHNQFSKNTS